MARKPAPTSTADNKGYRFIKTRSGAVYHWSERLAKASGSFPVSDQVAADYFRSIGADNAVTKANPPMSVQVSRAAEPADAAPKKRKSKAAKVTDATAENEAAGGVEIPPKKVASGVLVASDEPMTAEQIEEAMRG